MNKNLTTGQESESYLENLLKHKSWEILSKNFRRKGTEIDLIACKENTLIFVEVKYRRLLSSCTGIDAIERIFSPNKQRAIQRGVKAFICENQSFCSNKKMRIDLALLTNDKTKGSKRLFAYYPNVMNLEVSIDYKDGF